MALRWPFGRPARASATLALVGVLGLGLAALGGDRFALIETSQTVFGTTSLNVFRDDFGLGLALRWPFVRPTRAGAALSLAGVLGIGLGLALRLSSSVLASLAQTPAYGAL
jgi:hypothetical protein